MDLSCKVDRLLEAYASNLHLRVRVEVRRALKRICRAFRLNLEAVTRFVSNNQELDFSRGEEEGVYRKTVVEGVTYYKLDDDLFDENLTPVSSSSLST